VRRLSVEFNQAPTDQARALYQVISAGATDSAEAVRILDVANRLAVGGVTDVATAADGLTSVLNAYGLSVDDAIDVSDALFVGMKAGKTTISELSSTLGRVAPIAAQAGISIDELVGTVAALTKGGIETDLAVTGVRAILSAVIKPSAEAARTASELGLAFDATALRAKGLAGFMADVIEASGGSAETMAKLTGDVRALTPALALAGQAGVDLNEILDQMANKTGATGEAFNRIAESDAYRFEKAMGRLRDVGIDVGGAILDVALPPLELFANHLDDVGASLRLTFAIITGDGAGAVQAFRDLISAGEDAANALLDVGEAALQLPPSFEDWKASSDAAAAAAKRAGDAAAEAARKVREANEAKAFRDAAQYADELVAAQQLGLDIGDNMIRVLVEQRDLFAEIAANEKRSLADRIAARERELELAEAVANATSGSTGAMAFQIPGVPTLGTEPVSANLAPLKNELKDLGLTFEDVLGAVEPLLGGFAALADGLGLLDGNARTAVRGIADLIGGLQSIKGGGILGSLGGFGAILGGVGGILSLLGDRGPSETEQELIRIQEEQNAILERNTAALLRSSDALQSISQLQDIQTTIAGLGDPKRAGGTYSSLTPLLPTINIGDFGLPGGLPELPATLADIEEAARNLGIALYDSLGHQVPGAMEQLGRAIDQEIEKIGALQDAYRDNLEVRSLVAAGLNDEAEAKRQSLADQKEINDLIAAGMGDLVDELKDVQVAEAAARALAKHNEELRKEAEILATRQTFDTDIEVRRVKLGGDDRGYIETSMGARGDAELAATRKLVEAGTLTEEQFLALAGVIKGELLDALADFDQAAAETAARLAEAAEKTRASFQADVLVREAELSGNAIDALRVRMETQAASEVERARELLDAGTITLEWFDRFVDAVGGKVVQALADATQAAEELARAEAFQAAQAMDNLRVRLLTARGLTEEAQALRNRMEIQQAIESGRSGEYIALLRQVQAEEARSKALQEESAAVKETTERIKEVSQALNAPTGLNLSLLRWRAAIPQNRLWDQATPFSQPASDSGRLIGGSTVNNTRSSSVTMQLGAESIQISVPKGTNGAELVQQIRTELERIAMAGGPDPLRNLSVGSS